jgi:exopolyphosphatase/guanosine-5'-triphosphate,3'-diphosphate pyrophosphatase
MRVEFEAKTVSFIDIGTNSVRTAVVRLNPNHSYTILSRQKQVVRLGENEFQEQELIPQAMERCVMVCKRFAEMGRAFGAQEFVAVTTSATREARNQSFFLEKLKVETGLEVRVISGREEARLIHLGVGSALDLSGRPGLFIDIGGGSTELAIGNGKEHLYLDSLKLGAIRLTSLFVPLDDEGPVYPERYALMKKSVKSEIVRTVQRVRKYKVGAVVGSSGTILNLWEMATRSSNGGQKDSRLSLGRLKRTIAMLCSLPLKERRQVPGINPERADIIIGGAAILETLMEEMGLEEIQVSERGLLDGMLEDYLSQIEGFPQYQRMSVREGSVLQLGRSCGVDEVHSTTIRRLALELFDTAKEEGLHELSDRDRELLQYAAYLHDVGDFISFNNHHAHSYYIIRNAELLGFDQKEIVLMANLAKFHRKKLPGKKSEDLDEVKGSSKEELVLMASLLRLAESLDRSHCGLILHARFVNADEEEAMLEVTTNGDCQLETWGAESQAKAFKKAFGRDLVLRFRAASPLDPSS